MSHLAEQGGRHAGTKPPEVVLNAGQRRELERLVSAHKTGPALVRRARVVLLAAMGYSNTEIAEQVPMDVEAVGLWRRRWVAVDEIPIEEIDVEFYKALGGKPSKVTLFEFGST